MAAARNRGGGRRRGAVVSAMGDVAQAGRLINRTLFQTLRPVRPRFFSSRDPQARF